MEKLFTIRTFGKMATLFLFVVYSIGAFSQRFEDKKVFLSDKDTVSKYILVNTRTPFSIQKDSDITWAKHVIYDIAIKIHTSINTQKDKRTCQFFLLDENGNPVDTLEVVQLGKSDNTNLRPIVSSTGSALTRTNSTKSKSSSSSKTSYGGQCAAITQKGTRCSRKAAAGSIYCWQHK